MASPAESTIRRNEHLASLIRLAQYPQAFFVQPLPVQQPPPEQVHVLIDPDVSTIIMNSGLTWVTAAAVGGPSRSPIATALAARTSRDPSTVRRLGRS